MKKQNHVQTQVTWPKYQILKTQDGGRPPFWKWFYRYISAENHPISMKFDMQTEILVPRTVTCWFIKIWNSKWRSAALLKIVFWQYLHELLCDWSDISYVKVEPCWDTRHVTKIAVFENSRWRTAAILKMVSSHYLSRGSSDFNEIWCATVDFGSKDGHLTKDQNFANSIWRTAAILKIVFWLHLNLSHLIVRLTRFWYEEAELDSDTGHLTKIPKFENSGWRTTAILKMVSSLYLSCGYHPISMTFDVPLHNLVPRMVTY